MKAPSILDLLGGLAALKARGATAILNIDTSLVFRLPDERRVAITRLPYEMYRVETYAVSSTTTGPVERLVARWENISGDNLLSTLNGLI